MTSQLPTVAVFGLLLGTLTMSAGAQDAKKVFICVDMEGISGVSSAEQTGGTGADYNRARKMMADDTNAAIRGAVEGGATEIVVIDSHGSGHNLQRDDVEAPARLISENSFRRYGMMEGLDATFDAVLFIGHHAKAGSPVGVFAHTQNGNIRDVQINGRSVGEGGMNTLYAAWYGVPVVMVTGDQVAVAQIQEVATGALGVTVKRAINAKTVELRPSVEAREEITRIAAQAVRTAKKPVPRPAGPFRIQIWYRDSSIPDVGDAIPGIERPTPDSLAFTADSLPPAYALYRVLYRHLSAQ
jgi:D-amino peptidase